MSESQVMGLVPQQDEDSAGYWEALATGRVIVPRCASCQHLFFPPMPGCPHCGSAELSQAEVSGEGTVYSWVTVHIALDPAFAEATPYTIVTVELREDPKARIIGRLLGDPQRVFAAMPVKMTPYRVDAGAVLPAFTELSTEER